MEQEKMVAKICAALARRSTFEEKRCLVERRS
jgi:hypothetical protein